AERMAAQQILAMRLNFTDLLYIAPSHVLNVVAGLLRAIDSASAKRVNGLFAPEMTRQCIVAHNISPDWMHAKKRGIARAALNLHQRLPFLRLACAAKEFQE